MALIYVLCYLMLKEKPLTSIKDTVHLIKGLRDPINVI